MCGTSKQPSRRLIIPVHDRPIQLLHHELADAIARGTFDEVLIQTEEACKRRRLKIKEDLRARVQEVYGPNAEIVVRPQRVGS